MYNHNAASTETPGQQLDTIANILLVQQEQKGASAMCHRPKEQEYKLRKRVQSKNTPSWKLEDKIAE